MHLCLLLRNSKWFLKNIYIKHFVHLKIFWWWNYHIMCLITKEFFFSNLKLKLKSCYKFFYLENFGGWKFLFLFLKVESSCFYFGRLKVFVFRSWRFLFLKVESSCSYFLKSNLFNLLYFGGWRFVIYVLWAVYLHTLKEKIK